MCSHSHQALHRHTAIDRNFRGTWNLHNALDGHEPDFFLVYVIGFRDGGHGNGKQLLALQTASSMYLHVGVGLEVCLACR